MLEPDRLGSGPSCASYTLTWRCPLGKGDVTGPTGRVVVRSECKLRAQNSARLLVGAV